MGGLRLEAEGELAVGADLAEWKEEGEALLGLPQGALGAGTAPGGAGWPAGASSHSRSSALSCSDVPGEGWGLGLGLGLGARPAGARSPLQSSQTRYVASGTWCS